MSIVREVVLAYVQPLVVEAARGGVKEVAEEIAQRHAKKNVQELAVIVRIIVETDVNTVAKHFVKVNAMIIVLCLVKMVVKFHALVPVKEYVVMHVVEVVMEQHVYFDESN